MSADRYEITDTNGLRIDGIPWRERGLLVQYAAIRQQARDIAALKDALADEVTANEVFRKAGGARDDEDMPTFCARLIAERDSLTQRHANLMLMLTECCTKRDTIRTSIEDPGIGWRVSLQRWRQRAEQAEARLAAIDNAPTVAVVSECAAGLYVHQKLFGAQLAEPSAELIYRPTKDQA